MNRKVVVVSARLVVSVMGIFWTRTLLAQTEPIGGQPAAGAKQSVENLEDQVAYQRAFEAVVWSQPAVGIYGFRRAMFEGLGMKDNEVLAMSRPFTTRHEFLTANNTTPYITANADLRNGPVVLEIPAANNKGVLYGQVVDAWQVSIADVGPSGEDKGKGGKYLFLPPGYKSEVPIGYFAVPSSSYRIAFAFRSIKLPGMTDADANAYAKTLKMYPLSEAANPKRTRFVDAFDKRISTLPVYDWRYFEDVHAIVSVEPVQPRDKVMMGMLASLGIEPGKPFKPSPKMKDIMTRAAVDAYFYMQDRFDKVQMKNLYWPERYWSYFFLPDSNGGFAWETKTALLYDNRSDAYHVATYYPKQLPAKPATVYLVSMRDSEGRPLVAGKTYKLNVPKDVPVKQFWSLIVYDYATWAFIYNPVDRVGLSSYDKPNMKSNADGSVDLYIGPEPPKGYESNWIPTQGKRPVPCMRIYGGDEAFWDKSFKMPDLELVQ
jgi:hypothetical protein